MEPSLLQMMLAQANGQQQSPPPSMPPTGLANMFGNGGASGGASGMFSGRAGPGLGSLGTTTLFAAMIGLGKNTEANHPNSPLGQGLLAGLGPSASQVIKDPVGTDIQTAVGLLFLTPFTASKASQQTKPEWSGLFGLGF